MITTPKKPNIISNIRKYPGFSPRNNIARGTKNKILVKPSVTAVAKGISDNAVKPAIMAPMPKTPLKRCIENLLVDIIFIGLFFIINGTIIMNPKIHLKNAIWKGCSSEVKYFTIVPIIGKVEDDKRIKINP